MLSHTGTLGNYLGSFVLYTLLAIGMIYVAYLYARRSFGSTSLLGGKKSGVGQTPLVLESSLTLEPRKVLYVIRSGNERFLLSSAGDTTELVSRLESIPQPLEPVATLPEAVDATEDVSPWYSSAGQQVPRPVATTSIGSRFVQSVQWLVSSRSR